jgi:hypothetical protein
MIRQLLINLLPFLLVLFSCSNEDEIRVPTSLEFNELAEFTGESFQQATGLIASDNAEYIYLVNRDNQNGIRGERVRRYQINTGETKEIFVEFNDFITKNVHIVENELIVIGGSNINYYPLDLSSSPVIEQHGLSLSRFGSIIYENEIYIWGGDLNQDLSDRIQKWIPENQSFEIMAALPTPKSWAHGEVVDGWIYIFGGQEQFANTPPNDILYIYDIEDTTAATLNLPSPTLRTFTAQNNGLIYVAGHVPTEIDGDFDMMFGVFNTQTLTFENVRINLDETGPRGIYQMTASSDQLFILYAATEDLNTLKLMVADLP